MQSTRHMIIVNSSSSWSSHTGPSDALGATISGTPAHDEGAHQKNQSAQATSQQGQLKQVVPTKKQDYKGVSWGSCSPGGVEQAAQAG